MDFSEALILTDRVGETFEAVVVDLNDAEATIQLTEPAVVATIASGSHQLADRVHVQLESTDIYTRVLSFKLA